LSYAYSILTGVGFGGMIVLMPNLMGAYFGRTSYSQIVGWTTPVVMLLSAISPWLAGMLYDRRTVPPSLRHAMGLVVVGLMVAALAKPPSRARRVTAAPSAREEEI
jgi:MFS family permease